MEVAAVETTPSHTLHRIWDWAIGTNGRRWAVPPLLLLILAVALALRLYGINWDQGNFFHPDERSIYMRVDCMYRVLTEAPGFQSCTADPPFQQMVSGFPTPPEFLDAAKSPLNPHWFPLGTMIIYVLLGIKLLLAPIVTMGLDDLALAGRTLSALADVGTVAMVYVLGKRLYGRGAGLLAAALVAFAVVHIQISHFYRPETFSNLFTLAAFWAMLEVLERRRVRDSLLLGLFVGLAFATKVSVLPLVLPLAALYGYLLVRARGGPGTAVEAGNIEKVALRALGGGAVAVAVYIFWTPYALLGFPEFLEWNLRELDIIRNAGTVPYTVQYIGSSKFLYELQQTSVWGLGLPLGVLAWGGFLATLLRTVRRPRFGTVMLLLWAVPLLLTVGSVEVKFMRYTFPLMPVFILMGSGLSVQLVHWLSLRWRSLARGAATAIGLVVAATVFYTLAFASVYASPHTAVQASEWLNANVPTGSVIRTDNHWDEGIPDLGRFNVAQLPMFDGDSAAKIDSLATNLAAADYLVFYSNRTYGVITLVPERYPLSSAYYRLLFDGALGYELVQSFDSYPQLLGVEFANDTFARPGLPVPEPLTREDAALVTLDLGYADNDAINYDHPLVLVFENKAGLGRDYLLGLLLAPVPEERPDIALMLTPQELEAQQQGGTWADLFDQESLANRLPVLVWLLLVELASLAVLPIGYLVFRGLHDRGYLLSKMLALLLVAYIPWILAATDLMPFGRESIYLGLLALAIVGTLIVVRKGSDLADFVKTRWRTLALEEVIFLTTFLVFLALRWANPDLWHPFRGGEKPMDFAYLNAIVRSTSSPPYDPWFAGGYLNYYYFGQFMIATLIKATGILPEVAYNLAIPLLVALTAGGAFSVVYNLTHAFRQRRYGSRGPAWGPAAAGLAAVLMLAILGNLGGAIQIVRAGWETLTAGATFPAFDFWASSRMMPGQISITEFPFWTFLFADLHAHLIVIPVTLLAIGLALNLVLIAERWSVRWRTMIGPLAALGLAVGALAAINTWDYPSYLMLAMAAVPLGYYAHTRRASGAPAAEDTPAANTDLTARGEPFGGAQDMSAEPFEQAAHPELVEGRGRQGERRGAPGLALALVVVPRAALLAVLSYVLYLPFHARNVSFNAGVQSSAEQTEVHHYLAVHSLLLFILLSYLVYEGRGYMRRLLAPTRWLTPPTPDSTSGSSAAVGGMFVFVALVVLALIVAYLVAAGYATVAVLFVLAVVMVVLAVRRLVERGDESPYHLFLLALLGGGLALGMMVDLVTVNNDIDRMNTVFKLYLQAWVLFSLAAATMLWHLASAARFTLRGVLWAKGLWTGVLLLLVAASAVFPVLGTRARLADRFSTEFTGLNGSQFMESATYRDSNGLIDLRWDWEAIQWLRTNVQGSPVVAEGHTDPHNYRWGSRVSIYTGLPTIVGWSWHQTQQRMGDQAEVRRRLSQVRTLFSTTDEALAMEILREHRVRYIIVGELERLYYPASGLAKFSQMADLGIRSVYANEAVDIYEVALEEA